MASTSKTPQQEVSGMTESGLSDEDRERIEQFLKTPAYDRSPELLERDDAEE